MTLCTAWLRNNQHEGKKELVFATDSCLSAGERWPAGIKIFDFQRKDCLISFAGETYRAYPLIMNAIHLLKSNPILSNPYTSLHIVKNEFLELFTELSDKLYNLSSGDNKEDLKTKAQFLFGGWDYQKQDFIIWHIYYNSDVKYKKFIAEEIFFDDSRPAYFIGDDETALKKLLDLLAKSSKNENVELDMEPFKILLQTIMDEKNTLIDGPIQIAKVYSSGSNEFFGVYWPSSLGKPTLYGQEYNHHSKPFTRYIDPDTSLIIEDNIPLSKNGFNFIDKKYDSFIESCYQDNKLRDDLTNNEKSKLVLILKEIAYAQFLEQINEKKKEQGFEPDDENELLNESKDSENSNE